MVLDWLVSAALLALIAFEVFLFTRTKKTTFEAMRKLEGISQRADARMLFLKELRQDAGRLKANLSTKAELRDVEVKLSKATTLLLAKTGVAEVPEMTV